ncbi:uncharacterized protein [Musca autumnalis]|uniref:uncharacterized protein n=1 Tax=Musca autumnalis TaxID=221902 RepID=UPI003CF3BEAF
MRDYDDYIKCGEILLSPSITDKDQFILKCSDCDKYYLELRLFIPHWQKHYNDDSNESELETQCDKKPKKEELTAEDVKEEVENQEEVNDDEHQISLNEIEEQYVFESSNDFETEEVDPCNNTELNIFLGKDDEEEAGVNEEIQEEEEEPASGNVSESDLQEDLEGVFEDNSQDEDQTEDKQTSQARRRRNNNNKENQKYQRTKFVDDFFRCRTKVQSFIAVYKSQKMLWEYGVSSQLSAPQKIQYLKQIGCDFEEKHNQSLTMDQIRDIVAHLRSRYRIAIQNDGGENKSKSPWYVKLLNFLPSASFNPTLTQLGCHNLKKVQIIQILKIYEEFPHLWNTDLVEYVCNNKRDEALKQMIDAIQQKFNLEININDLKMYVSRINLFCSRDKRLEMKKTEPEAISEYYKHMKYLRDHVGPFECFKCKKTFVHAFTFKTHVDSHGGNGSVKCKICEKTYTIYISYVQHCRRHMDDLPSECKECGKRFIRDADMRLHLRTHSGAKPYCCELCGKEFRHSNALLLHKKRHNKEYCHTCPECPRQFYALHELKNHMVIHRDERNCVCNICGKAFKAKTTLKSHLLTHETELKYPCEICGKMFKNRMGIYHHMKTHRRREHQENKDQMNDYTEYIKIGEILKSPMTINSNYQYILKCHHDKYFELEESFMLPCLIHCAVSDEESESDEKPDIVYNDNDECNDNKSEDGVLKAVYILEDVEIMNDEKNVKDPLKLVNKNITKSEKDIQQQEESITEFTEKLNEIKPEGQEEYANNSNNVNPLLFDNEATTSEDDDTTSVPTFIKNFIKSQKNLKAFIDSYKEQTELWETPSKQNIKNKEKFWEIMRQDLKNKSHIEMTTTQIAKIIKYLNLQYKHSIQGKDPQQQSPPQTLWFIKDLEFLKPNNETAKPNVKLKPQHCDLTQKQITQLLGIYEKFPNLWNTNLIEHWCRNKRNEAMVEMLQAVNTEMDLKIDETGLKEHLQFLHNEFSKEKRFDIQRDSLPVTRHEHPYYEHMLFLYDHVRPFKCSDCGLEQKNPLYVKIHKSQHDGTMPLKCSLCAKEFKVLSTYIQHARRHMDDLDDICQECGKKFISSYELQIHMRLHTAAKPFCCEICGVSFRHIQTFTGHKRRHEKKYLHHCPTCSKGFYSKAKLEDHIRSHKQIREFKCETCGKAFITKKTLQQHLVIHEDIRKYVCSLCGKSFKLKVGLKQHMRTHGSQSFERPEEV